MPIIDPKDVHRLVSSERGVSPDRNSGPRSGRPNSGRNSAPVSPGEAREDLKEFQNLVKGEAPRVPQWPEMERGRSVDEADDEFVCAPPTHPAPDFPARVQMLCRHPRHTGPRYSIESHSPLRPRSKSQRGSAEAARASEEARCRLLDPAHSAFSRARTHATIMEPACSEASWVRVQDHTIGGHAEEPVHREETSGPWWKTLGQSKTAWL